MRFEKKLLSQVVATLPFISFSVAMADTVDLQTLSPVVVTGEVMDAPLTVNADPKTPRQPVPSHDGADYLKTIPGFTVTRKGGTDGDAQFRGMSGSRLGILVDGENILGGCNARMDAPTAYIFPEIYDALTVIKGPQTVLHGPGNSAATVLFERDIQRFSAPAVRVHASALTGSADRHDLLTDVQAGNAVGYVQLTGSDSRANDYRDGNGDKVHSEYHRYSGQMALGLTPDDNTRAEVSTTRSDGTAAYADRGMDGTQFLRQGQSIRLGRKKLSKLIDDITLQAYQNSVDHIMDDQTLRTPGMMGYANLKRDTDGGRIAVTLNLSAENQLTLGVDTQNNAHSARRAGINHQYSGWSDDANFNQRGVFVEWEHLLDKQNRVITGLRGDQWEATDQRPAMVMSSMMPMHMMMNPSSGETRTDTLSSGFFRLEHDLKGLPATLYAGLGHVERFPDYWELIAKQGDGSFSAFRTAHEITDQLDAGTLYQSETTTASLSAFYSQIKDYILIDYTRMDVMNGYSRNINATTYGAELTAAYALTHAIKLDGALTWTWGSNDTDETSLAQLPPLEGRLGLTYTDNDWTAGALLRAVDDQDRLMPGAAQL